MINLMERSRQGILSLGKRTLAGDTRLTLFLVEDNIKARFQAGSIHDFTHHHVNRAVNTAWGDRKSVV